MLVIQTIDGGMVWSDGRDGNKNLDVLFFFFVSSAVRLPDCVVD